MYIWELQYNMKTKKHTPNFIYLLTNQIWTWCMHVRAHMIPLFSFNRLTHIETVPPYSTMTLLVLYLCLLIYFVFGTVFFCFVVLCHAFFLRVINCVCVCVGSRSRTTHCWYANVMMVIKYSIAQQVKLNSFSVCSLYIFVRLHECVCVWCACAAQQQFMRVCERRCRNKR